MRLELSKNQISLNRMKDQNNQRPSILVVLSLSWFYSGKFPKAPGTMGSLATIPLIFILSSLQINIYSLISLIVVLYLISVFLTEHIQKKFHLHDPQWIVIDEVIGMLTAWSFVRSTDFSILLIVFILFRFFDIVKIWPASYFDRLHHGIGTITDDVISGLYAGIFSYFIQKLL
jgi:phosphatidylglycerophosphatase A